MEKMPNLFTSRLLFLITLLVCGVLFSAETAHAQIPTIYVNSDDDDNYLPGVSCRGANECTLRQAIIHASGTLNDERIYFDLTNYPNGMTIHINSALPELESEMMIDGVADNAASCADGDDSADLRVTIDGSNAGATTDGLRLSFRNTVHGVSIVNFGGDGIFMPATYIGNNDVAVDGGENVVTCSFIGIETDGDAAGNGVGIKVASDDNRIGGAQASGYTAGRNIISGNDGSGVWVLDGGSADIHGNTIGLAYGEIIPRPNGNNGIFIDGSALIKGNLIAHNTLYGVNVAGSGTIGGTSASDQNIIGLSGNGFAAPNHSGGIFISGDYVDVINNVVSGNDDDGIQSSGRWADIEDNLVGISADGTTARPNADAGIIISNGWADVRNNVVSGNGDDGIVVSGDDDGGAGNPFNDATIIEDNLVGTTPSGTSALGNSDDGIVISVDDITIQNNTVAANGDDGIVLLGEGITASGNFVGTNAATTLNLGNGEDGIQIEGVDAVVLDNVVMENSDNGIFILGDRASIGRNFIGINAALTLSGGNGLSGVRIEGGSSLVGGFDPTEGNIIVANGKDGITLNGTGATNNGIRNNLIGTAGLSNNGTLENDGHGISIESGANNNTIGSLGDENIITNNEKSGINLLGLNSDENNLRYNFIYDNAALGIDLRDVGEPIGTVTANDSGDNDDGPNELQNGIALISAESSGRLQGTLLGKNTPYHIDIYEIESCDGSGYGEGGTNLIATYTQTPSGGVLNFDEVFSPAPTLGNYLTALITDNAGNTSEFSNCAPVVQSGFVVNDSGNRADQTPGDGACTVAISSKCTLRAVIQEVNALGGGPYVISFNFAIVGGLAPIISPDDSSTLPAITTPIILDVSTLPNAVCGSADSPANHRLILDGSNVTTGDGLTLAASASGSTIRGLLLRNFPDDGIRVNGDDNIIACNTLTNNGGQAIDVTGSDNRIGGTAHTERNVIINGGSHGVRIGDSGTRNKVQGNYIGVAGDGMTAAANAGSGVYINAGGTNRVGGGVTLAGNVISGNTEHGILLAGGGGDNQIWGNIIGLDASGLAPMGNGSSGVRIFDSVAANDIGGENDGRRNVISANAGQGIYLESSSNTVIGNYIGTDINGMNDLGNSVVGVRILNGDSNSVSENIVAGNDGTGVRVYGNAVLTTIIDNSIGVDVNGEPAGNGASGVLLQDNVAQATIRNNVIANNDNAGIAVESTVITSKFSRNAIYNNGGLGIDLNNDGIANENDNNDSDDGANGLMNYPVIYAADADSDVISVLYNVHDTPTPQSYRIHVYRNASCDEGDIGEGQTYLGSFDITTASNNGNSTESAFLPDFDGGDFLTATLTPLDTGHPSDGTSEFSNCFTATGGTPTAVGGIQQSVVPVHQRWLIVFSGCLLVVLTAWRKKT